MSELNTGAPEGAAEAPVIVNVPADAPEKMSISQAARALASARKPKEKPAPVAAPVEAAPEPPQSPAVAEDSAPPLEAPAETQEPDQVAEQPSIEPPRSWTKEAKERWQSLPRETQEYLAEREQERDREVRRSQNEAAEKQRSLTSKEQALEQARAQYEQALPVLMQNLQASISSEFADIKSMADVQRMANEDWPRYARWDAQQKQLAAAQQQHHEATQRQANQWRQQFEDFASREDSLLVEKNPELADASKASKLQDSAIKTLKNIGFTEKELAPAWMGEASISLRDHRIQTLILKAAKYDEAQVSPKLAAPKPVPPVQRPGVAPNKGSRSEATIQALTDKLDNSRGMNALRAGADLLKARRAGKG